MNQILVLPPVAKSFSTHCKKCDTERYHRVITHTSDTSAKIECEICKSKSTFSLNKPTKKTAVVRKASGPTSGKGRSGIKRSTHADEFKSLMLNRGTEKGEFYNIKIKFAVDQKIEHPKFGPGFVKNAQSDRIDVMFEEEVKTLMHNKIS